MQQEKGDTEGIGTGESLIVLQMAIVAGILATIFLFRYFVPNAYHRAASLYEDSFEQEDLSPQLVRFAGAALDALTMPVSAESAVPKGTSGKRYLPRENSIRPVEGFTVSSQYGWRVHPVTKKKTFHQGIDLACAEGTPVYAAMDGMVEFTLYSESGGNSVRLRHKDGVETAYCHMQYTFVRTGEMVQAGTQIGTAGSTGNATGPHLHFALLYDDCYYDPSGMLGLD